MMRFLKKKKNHLHRTGEDTLRNQYAIFDNFIMNIYGQIDCDTICLHSDGNQYSRSEGMKQSQAIGRGISRIMG